jgi:origin recognition complex subunit 1
MDFPEKLQPKVASRMGQGRLVFRPYSQAELQRIVESRLLSSTRFTPDAISYICKKLTAFTSDIRKLLQVLRRAL